MWMCSSVPGNECIKIPTPEFSFNDLYDCTVYGYAHSEDIIVSLTRDFVNEKQVFTKFSCNFQEIV
tara:strand:+ start:506 stop:703 length:198 start_codon:yes stop_codon:yes gene_type:complete